MNKEQVQSQSALLLALSSATFLFDNKPGKMSYQNFSLSLIGNCMNLYQFSGQLTYLLMKIPYTIQPEYESNEVPTTNIIIARCEGSSIDYMHYMISSNENNPELRIKLMSTVDDGPIKTIHKDNVSFRTILSYLKEFISSTLGDDHAVVNYQKIFKPLVNDEHMTKVYEEIPANNIDMKDFLTEIR